ncbi:21.7 kDa class VI heat shock protein [Platanthera guangdongensis]|uniref:21.7 kDa class VI heat shock protein n=1 Tax=Platanthera guangdongensis TaxID=2320717 RepID=A0ABR2MVY6_9ASPA
MPLLHLLLLRNNRSSYRDNIIASFSTALPNSLNSRASAKWPPPSLQSHYLRHASDAPLPHSSLEAEKLCGGSSAKDLYSVRSCSRSSSTRPTPSLFGNLIRKLFFFSGIPPLQSALPLISPNQITLISSDMNYQVALCGDKGRVIEISGKWEEKEAGGENWRNNQGWEHGFVRRLEVPDDADLMKMEPCIADDVAMEIKLSKKVSNSQINDGEMKES